MLKRLASSVFAFAVLFGLMLAVISPPAVAVAGYFFFYHSLPWFYAVGTVVLWILSTAFVTFSAKPESQEAVFRQAAGGSWSLVWLLCIAASAWFIFDALVLGGSWRQLYYSVLVGGLAKAVSVSFFRN